MEFVSFPKITRIEKQQLTITEKLNGTHAIVFIEKNELGEYTIKAGSRNRWLTVEDDNYGFARWVETNKEALISSLGEGRHHGEYMGLGVNSNYGLNERWFVLFEFWKHEGKELPPQVKTVPVLYQGPYTPTKVAEVMEDLRLNGSRMVPGFMRPEGVVFELSGIRYKDTFDKEEVAWEKPEAKPKKPKADYGHLLQPLRLEKLLSKDEKYRREYPESIGRIVADYFADLVSEGQISGTPDEIKRIKKQASWQIFEFVRLNING